MIEAVFDFWVTLHKEISWHLSVNSDALLFQFNIILYLLKNQYVEKFIYFFSTLNDAMNLINI